MKSLKNALSRTMRSKRIPAPHWQKTFFDHVLRGADFYTEKWHYVCENPVRAGFVRVEDWPFQGEIFALEYRSESSFGGHRPPLQLPMQNTRGDHCAPDFSHRSKTSTARPDSHARNRKMRGQIWPDRPHTEPSSRRHRWLQHVVCPLLENFLTLNDIVERHSIGVSQHVIAP